MNPSPSHRVRNDPELIGREANPSRVWPRRELSVSNQERYISDPSTTLATRSMVVQELKKFLDDFRKTRNVTSVKLSPRYQAIDR